MKKLRKMKNNKQKNTCEFCGKIGNPNTMIHKNCAIPYLKSLGFDIIKFKSPVEYLDELFKDKRGNRLK